MSLTNTAIKFNRITIILLVIIVALGLSTFEKLPRDSMPPFTIRTVTIVTYFPGASPERIESLITDKIEKVTQEIPQVKDISSTSRTGLSIITVELFDNVDKKNLQSIWDRLRRKINNINDFPQGIYGPDIQDEGIGEVFGIFLAFESDGYSYKEIKDYAEDLRNKIIVLDDAAKVEFGGIIDEKIFVEFNDAVLSRYGLSGNTIQGTISAHNIITSAGEINLGNESIILEPSGNFETIDDIKKILIPVGTQGETIPLGDVTNIYKDYISPYQSTAKLNGQKSIFLYISLKEEANLINLGKDIDKLLKAYNKNLPVGLNVVRTSSQDYYVDSNILNFVNNVLQSLVIVLVIMFLFLGFRTGIVVASLIPITVVMTFWLMGTFGVGLNQVSLASLIMALGMLVDNSIVVTESYMVRLKNGESKLNAAVNTGKELIVPLLTSSLTTSAAFLSFFLAESTMGEIMGQLFSVITISLLSSWLVALTIIPMLAMLLIKIKKETKKSIFDKLIIYYKKFIVLSLAHPIMIVLVCVALLILSIYGFNFIPSIFMPDSDRNLVTMDINLPLGSRIETTEENVEKIEKFINDSLLLNKHNTRGITSWSTFIGVGPNSYDLGYNPEEQNSAYAHFLINTSSFEDNKYVMNKLDKFCFNNLFDAQVTIKPLNVGGGSGIPIEVRVSGSEPDSLFAISEKIKKHLKSMKGTKNIDDNWGPKIKKFFIKVHQSKLNRSGFTNYDIAVSLNTVLTGRQVGEYRESKDTYPIELRSIGRNEIRYDNIESLTIFSQNSGQSIPLGQVATIIPKWQYSKILRKNLLRTMSVKCQVDDDTPASGVISKLKPWILKESKNWPNGYSYEFGGDEEDSAEAMTAVNVKLPVSFFIIIMLLVIQFNSIRKTIIILATIPFGVIGLVGGLLITRSFFSFTAFLGLISLVGIIINNAIVLIDRIEIEQNQNNLSPYQSIIRATTERFRPILLTTFTTSFGMLPLWFGGGLMWQPMAIGIIFGLFFATIITLFLVPVMYKLLFKVKIN